MDWIDSKYVNLLSSRYERWSRINNDTYKFRCPFCGDSKTKKSKVRGYIFVRANKTRYYCHNCSASMQFAFFLKHEDSELYKDYVREKFLEKKTDEFNFSAPKERESSVAEIKRPNLRIGSFLKSISQLPHDHPAKLYVINRKIPNIFHYKLFYAPKFKSWVNTVISNKFSDLTYDEPRLIIPINGPDGTLIGFQGRSFKKKDPVKYITIILDKSQPCLYNQECIDKSRLVYVVEGPIDAMFLSNAIAAVGGLLVRNLSASNIPKDKIVIVLDNEPRNREIVNQIENAIKDGYQVFIPPTDQVEKDLNDLSMAGHSFDEIKSRIDANTFSGIQALIQLSKWKKSDDVPKIQFN